MMTKMIIMTMMGWRDLKMRKTAMKTMKRNKLIFSSQETPEEQAAAFTAPPQSMMSPKTLFVLTKDEMQKKHSPLQQEGEEAEEKR
jgi:hypothetical protein